MSKSTRTWSLGPTRVLIHPSTSERPTPSRRRRTNSRSPSVSGATPACRRRSAALSCSVITKYRSDCDRTPRIRSRVLHAHRYNKKKKNRRKNEKRSKNTPDAVSHISSQRQASIDFVCREVEKSLKIKNVQVKRQDSRCQWKFLFQGHSLSVILAKPFRFPHSGVTAVTATPNNRDSEKSHFVAFVVAMSETLLAQYTGAVRLALHAVEREVSFLEHVAAYPLGIIAEVSLELLVVFFHQIFHHMRVLQLLAFG